MLRFGEDGIYDAYIVDAEAEIGEHYRKVMEFSHWIRIYDDDGLVCHWHARTIEIYRSGVSGCIIRLVGRRKEGGTYGG